MMKTSCFTFLAICLISYNFTSGKTCILNLMEEMTVCKDSTLTTAHTTTNYLISTTGKANSVQITTGKTKSADTRQEKRNKIEINGEQNSVNITENGSKGSIQIKQNGNNNHINISQSDGKSEK